jgi:hypothetical protein
VGIDCSVADSDVVTVSSATIIIIIIIISWTLGYSVGL